MHRGAVRMHRGAVRTRYALSRSTALVVEVSVKQNLVYLAVPICVWCNLGRSPRSSLVCFVMGKGAVATVQETIQYESNSTKR